MSSESNPSCSAEISESISFNHISNMGTNMNSLKFLKTVFMCTRELNNNNHLSFSNVNVVNCLEPERETVK